MEGENERGRDDRRDVVKLATLSEQFALGFKGNVISVADSGKSPLLSIILPAVGLWLSPSLFPLSCCGKLINDKLLQLLMELNKMAFRQPKEIAQSHLHARV